MQRGMQCDGCKHARPWCCIAALPWYLPEQACVARSLTKGIFLALLTRSVWCVRACTAQTTS